MKTTQQRRRRGCGGGRPVAEVWPTLRSEAEEPSQDVPAETGGRLSREVGGVLRQPTPEGWGGASEMREGGGRVERLSLGPWPVETLVPAPGPDAGSGAGTAGFPCGAEPVTRLANKNEQSHCKRKLTPGRGGPGSWRSCAVTGIRARSVSAPGPVHAHRGQ